MAFIFIDESGDLGFKKTSSKWFIFAAVFSQDEKPIESVMKRVWRNLKKKHKSLGELHSHKAHSSTRSRVLKSLSKIPELKIFCVVLNKDNLPLPKRDEAHKLYKCVAHELIDLLVRKIQINNADHLFICFDKKYTNKFLHRNFLLDTMHSFGRISNNLKIEIRASHNSKSLQAIDFISHAIFRKYERDDQKYFQIIREKIIEEKRIFLEKESLPL